MDVTDLVYIDSTGFNCADAPTFLSYFQGQYRGIYGSDIYLGSDSQDGQWVSIVSQALYDLAQVAMVAFNGNSPSSAQGASLARLVKLNGISKGIPTNSTVALTITGINGTTLINCIAIDTLQQQWVIPTTTIPSTGTVTITATAAVQGAITAQPGTITGIFTPTNGWQTVTNAAAAIAGAPVESDAALRVRRTASVSLPAQTVFDATIAAVENVPGVTQVAGYENPTSSVDSNGLAAHSIALVVEGGDSAAIAKAIQVKKTPGTFTNGSTTVLVTDSQGMIVPINFYIPTVATISAQITLIEGTGWNTNTRALIATAVAAALSAYPIGGTIVLTQLFYAAYLYGTPEAGTFTVASIEIEKNSGGFSTSNISLAFNEIPVSAASNISITPST